MWDIFLQTLPFFAIIGLGYGAGRTGLFTPEATAYLTKFVFYFALSAMLLRFSANASLGELWDWGFVTAYFCGTALVYGVGMAVALLRRQSLAEAAVEAQCVAIGNIGFLGFPMLALLLGEPAVGYIVVMLAVDLIVFSSLIVILITLSREGRLRPAVIGSVALGLVRNPMILSIALGLALSGGGVPIPVPVNSFLMTLGAAATPGALFAIGASLATKSAERLAVMAVLRQAGAASGPCGCLRAGRVRRRTLCGRRDDRIGGAARGRERLHPGPALRCGAPPRVGSHSRIDGHQHRHCIGSDRLGDRVHAGRMTQDRLLLPSGRERRNRGREPRTRGRTSCGL